MKGPLPIAFALALLAAPAFAEGGCEGCRVEDEMQAGDYTPPLIPEPRKVETADPRGKEVDLPIPGAPAIHHRAGAGVWVGEAGEGNNLFLNGNQKKATLGLKRDF